MAFKHDAKRFLREIWARTLFHTGAHRIIDRIQPRRLTILAGHSVTAPSNSKLPPDMKIEAQHLERILTFLRAHFEVVTVAEGVTRLRTNPPRSLVALTMDDGYLDNRTHLLPLLQKLHLSATIYLESNPLDTRIPNWSHKFFAILEHQTPADFIHRFTELSTDTRSNVLLNQLVPHDQATAYHVKRLLKYEVPAAERSRVIDLLLTESHIDALALTNTLYLTWDDARALQAAGIELGAHTIHHEILSRLDATSARTEIEGSRAALTRALNLQPQSFAYPFGRRWDFNDDSARITREAGFTSATTTHAGTNSPSTDPYRLKRVMIDENAKLHLIATEACGGFDFLRRFRLDLSE